MLKLLCTYKHRNKPCALRYALHFYDNITITLQTIFYKIIRNVSVITAYNQYTQYQGLTNLNFYVYNIRSAEWMSTALLFKLENN